MGKLATAFAHRGADPRLGRYRYSPAASREVAIQGRADEPWTALPAANRRTNEVFGLAQNLARTCGLDLPGGASAHSRHRFNPGRPRVSNCLGDALRLRGHGPAAATPCQDFEPLHGLLH